MFIERLGFRVLFLNFGHFGPESFGVLKIEAGEQGSGCGVATRLCLPNEGPRP